MVNTAQRVSSLSALGILVSTLFLGTAASAGETSLSVLGLEPAAGAPDSVATAVTEALRQRVTSSGMFRLVQGRDLVEVKLVFSCPDEAPTCMTQAAQSIGANKLIFGSVQPVGTDAFIVTVKLLDAERGVVESWISEQITKAQATPAGLRGPVQKWFATLTGQAQPGTLKLTGGVVGAAVWLDGVQAGLLGADGLMLAGVGTGPHQVTVSKAGYEKWERTVTLASGGSEKVQVQLKSIENPSDGLAQAETSPLTQAPSPAPEPYNQGSRVGAWALLGLGLVGVGLGGYSSYKVSSINSDLDPYRRYTCAANKAQLCDINGKAVDPLDAKAQAYVQSQQSSGDSWSTVQWVGYGVGGALLVTSAVLFYRGYFAKPDDSTAKGETGSKLVLLPSLAPGNVGALAFVSF